jgi:hypothetical protein
MVESSNAPFAWLSRYSRLNTIFDQTDGPIRSVSVESFAALQQECCVFFALRQKKFRLM